MRIEVVVALSVDGFISGVDGYEEWIKDENGSDSFNNYAKQFDAIVLGSKTYFENLGTVYPVSGTRNIVLSSRGIDDDNFEIFKDSPTELISQLKAQGQKSVLVVGGGKVFESFIAAKLVNEILVLLHPIILGGGTRFIEKLPSYVELRQIESSDHSDGYRSIRYEVLSAE